MSTPERSAHGAAGWLDSLREELDRRFQAERNVLEERDRRYCELRAADAKSVEIAKGEVDRRLAEMNELRRQIERERGEFMRRDEYDIRHDALVAKVDLQHEQLAELRTEVAVGPEELRLLSTHVAQSIGEKLGFNEHRAAWFATGALLLSLVGVALHFA